VLLCYDYRDVAFTAAALLLPHPFVAGTTKEPKPHTPPFGGDLRALTQALDTVAGALCISIT
jgi:hypothetical protein